MLAPLTLKLRRAAGRLKNRIAPGALILLYHRIAEAERDPWSLCVTPQHFTEHLAVLRDKYSPISLQGLNRALAARQCLPGSVVITFDDGYADNLHQAKPLLEHYDIPATVFVISGSIGADREFWWDELERLILQPEVLPETSPCLTAGNPFRWTSAELGKRSDKGWLRNGTSPKDWSGERQSLYRQLWERLSLETENQRRELLDQLLAWSHAEPGSRSTYRPLTSEELIELGQGELIEIGSHTVNHPFLSNLATAAQMKELRQSRCRLEEILGSGVTSFSYPHGDYDRKTAALVAEAGYSCACSTVAKMVRGNSHPFQLPRIVVEDCDGEEFGRQLSSWLGS